MAGLNLKFNWLLRTFSYKYRDCVNGYLIPGQNVYSTSTSASANGNFEYAFQMNSANIRYGPGVTREVGMDFTILKVKKLCVVTDKNLSHLPGLNMIHESLQKNNINYEVYDDVCVEPTDISMKDAIAFAQRGQFDAFIAFGGGSVMDTCKAANLYSSLPDADFLDYVVPPIGKGLPIQHQLHPMIAIPTTSGTGSETTPVAIFDFQSSNLKTVIAGGRSLRPLIGLIDPLNVLTMPSQVAANSGFDVLCHALESYTVFPYTDRSPRPTNPKDRPSYQGCNPISDVWSREALRIISTYFKRSVKNTDDYEARSAMHLAAVFAGFGFGSAGVHLCHAMSYAIAGNVKSSYRSPGYNSDHALVPHGLSVVLPAPAVFSFTYPTSPERHLEAAKLLGADVSGIRLDDSGRILSDTIRQYMQDLGVANGLTALGFTREDIPTLVTETLPHVRATKMCPRSVTSEDYFNLFEQSLTSY